MFLLEITDEYENDTIICHSSLPVSEGDKICVYGNGTNVGTYTKTYYDGVPVDYEFEALDFNVGYILYGDIPYEGEIPSYVCNFIYGEYILKYDYDTPYYMEDYLVIDEFTINGREYSVKSADMKFSYTPDWDNLDGIVCINMVVSTTDKHGNKITMGIFVDLDGIGSNYILAKDDSNSPFNEFRSFVRK